MICHRRTLDFRFVLFLCRAQERFDSFLVLRMIMFEETYKQSLTNNKEEKAMCVCAGVGVCVYVGWLSV